MAKKIKLNFIVVAYAINKCKKKTTLISNYYDENLTFNDILREIYENYSLDKLSQEDLEPFGYSALMIDSNLFEIDYNFQGFEAEPVIYDYDNIEIKYLEKQFKITKKTFEIWLDPGIGGEIGRCRGIHFFFHTNEKDLHHRPHIHCKCGSEEFRVDLNNIEIIDIGFKNKQRTKKAIELIKLNQNQLIKYWNNVVVKGETVKFKMYIPKL